MAIFSELSRVDCVILMKIFVFFEESNQKVDIKMKGLKIYMDIAYVCFNMAAVWM